MESENSNATSNTTNTSLFALRLPSCVILAADSQRTSLTWAEVVDYNLSKIVELYPRVVVGFSGDGEVIHMLVNVLVSECRAQLPNPSSMQHIADFVARIVNQSLDLIQRKDPVHREVGLVLVGAVRYDDFKIFTISNNGWEHGVRVHEELGNMYTDGTGKSAVKTFCTNSGIDIDTMTVTEEEGVTYAFQGVNYVIRNNCFTGGRPIHVISINPNSCVYHLWTQDNPENCDNEYIYRGIV